MIDLNIEENGLVTPVHELGETQLVATLDRLTQQAISLADDGQIIVNKGTAFRIDKGDADKPSAFLPFA